MKKCPYCFEDVLKEAIKCKHCKSDLTNSANQISKTDNTNKPGKKILNKKNVGWALAILLALSLWYISLPVILIWYIWKKSKLNTKNKTIATASVLVVFVICLSAFLYTTKAPVISISEPQNNLAIQGDKVVIKGSFSPSNAQIKVNGHNLGVVIDDSKFIFEGQLSEEYNKFVVSASNGNKTSSTTLTIQRILTDEEKKLIEDAKAQKVLEAKIKADEEQKNKLLKEIDGLNKFDGSKYRESVDTILLEATFFSAYKEMIDNAKLSDNTEVKKVGKQLENKLIQIQTSEFPLMRKAYGTVVNRDMWAENGEASVYGTGNKTVELVSVAFASNKNIAKLELSAEEALIILRFNRVIYKWYKYDDNYFYYDLKSPKDSEITHLTIK